MPHALRSRRWATPVAVAAMCGATCTFDALGDDVFTPLPTYPGSLWTQSCSLSADGTTVVGEAMLGPAGMEIAILWNSSGVVRLGTTVQSGGARAVSADGSVVAGFVRTPLGMEAFRWTAATGLQPIGSLGATSNYYASGMAMSADGSAVFGITAVPGATSTYRAFRWNASGGMTAMGDLPGSRLGYAAACSANGSLIAGTSQPEPGIYHAVAWNTSGEMQTLGPGIATGASPSGGIIVGEGDNGAFRWTPASGYVSLAPLPGALPRAFAVAVSGDGRRTVGYTYLTAGQEVAVIWDAEGNIYDLRTLLIAAGATNLDNWKLLWASGVSNDGSLACGVGVDLSGHQQAFMCRLPSTCYPNCDASSHSPVLNVADFICFLNRFAAADPYANCDGSSSTPILNVSDFMCFSNRFAAGCP